MSSALTYAMLRRLLVAFTLLQGFASPAPGQPAADPGQSGRKLVVGTMRVPPFAMRGDDGAWSGLSIELWQRVAAELKLDYEFREFDYDFAGLLNAVEAHQIDLAAAAIPVTPEGEARFDFSHPYFAAGLGIAVRTFPENTIFGTLKALLTPQFLTTIAVLACVLVVFGGLVWLVERRRNAAQFNPRALQGVGDGVWWAAVTMTTTGFGDKAPITAPGRIIAVVWMFMSIFFIAMFSATLASTFVVRKLQTTVSGPNDLNTARVAIVSDSAGEQWVRLQGLRGRDYPFVIQASKALQRGDVDALVYERAILGHMIKEFAWADLQVLPQTLAIRDYGFALPTDSPLKEAVNRALLRITQGRDWRDVVRTYVGGNDP